MTSLENSLRRARLATLVATLSVVSGCATTAARPHPSVTVPTQWSADLAVVPASGPGDAWWRDFDNTELDGLVDAALQSNRDLRIAAARVAQARALSDGADADGRPRLDLDAQLQHGRQSGADPKVNLVSAGFRASWELDFFGGNALASTAARRDAESAGLADTASRVAIAADVATAYFEAQVLARRQVVARNDVATLEREIDVARRRFEAGQLTALDIDRIAIELRQSRAGATQLEAEFRIRLRQLAVLTGGSEPLRSVSPVLPDAPGGGAPRGALPAELLERRPDVQRQARAMDAAVARLGVAKRDLYPHIELDWTGKREWLKAQGVAEASPTLVIGYGLSVSMPILDGGRIRSNIAVHDAQAQEAMAEYEKAMLNALADAEIALRQQAAAEAGVIELSQAEHASVSVMERSERLFAAGLIDLNTALDAQREQLRAQDALLQAQGSWLIAAVAVRRAFAGGV